MKKLFLAILWTSLTSLNHSAASSILTRQQAEQQFALCKLIQTNNIEQFKATLSKLNQNEKTAILNTKFPYNFDGVETLLQLASARLESHTGEVITSLLLAGAYPDCPNTDSPLRLVLARQWTLEAAVPLLITGNSDRFDARTLTDWQQKNYGEMLKFAQRLGKAIKEKDVKSPEHILLTQCMSESATHTCALSPELAYAVRNFDTLWKNFSSTPQSK